MSLLSTATRRRFLCLASAALVAAPATALAQAAEPRPVIDAAPTEVRFRSGAVIKGHVEGGETGDRVALQRRRRDGSWSSLAERTLGQRRTLRFELRALRVSTSLRLVWHDPESERERAGDPVRVRVAPDLSAVARPARTYLGRRVRIAGSLYPKVPGRRVAVEIRTDGTWKRLGRPRVRDGRFRLVFRPHRQGRSRRIRVLFAGDRLNPNASALSSLSVFRRAPATWYGPGFYGERTACGRRLGYDTVGVAHRTLPCGTVVAILYRGRTISAPVIDRGPYSAADWDLTRAAAQKLRFSGYDSIGVAR